MEFKETVTRCIVCFEPMDFEEYRDNGGMCRKCREEILKEWDKE